MSTHWKRLLPLLSALLFVISCGTATAPAPSVVPSAPVDGLVDPRIGQNLPLPAALMKKFDAAWRDLSAGNADLADSAFQMILGKHPEYTPAILGRAAIDVQKQQYDEAMTRVDEVLASQPDNFAALYYRADIESRRGENAAALQHFLALAPPDDLRPVVDSRISALRTTMFNELYAQATRESDAAAAAEALRKALALQPEASGARLLLVQKLIDTSRFDDARRQIEPLLHASDSANQPEVQEALARIDIGKGRYQEAIGRYEQLARAYPGRFDRQLGEIKQRWVEMNLPPQYQSALANPVLTRSDLAVLIFWDLPSVRFATNLPEPPIAVDIPTAGGREEFVRALSLGLFSVDPITRRAYPDRTISSSAFLRIAARLLNLRGTPPCAGGAPGESDAVRAMNMLSSCGIPTNGLTGTSESSVTGRQVHDVLDGLRRK